MATTAYIKNKNLRKLDENTFLIKKVYPSYRDGGLETKQPDGTVKYVGKTFVYVPKRIKDEVVLQGDEQLKFIQGDEMELREAVWDKELKTRKFVKVKQKLDKDFFSTYKKVYDVEVAVKSGFTIPVWDKDAKKEVDTKFDDGVSATLVAFPAGRLKNMIEALDLDKGIQLVQGKDKAGNDAMVRPFDWEDTVKNKLEGKFVEMRVRGTGLDTKYSFREGKEFVELNTAEDVFDNGEEIAVEDIPF
jgi:hypothetical protein